MVRISTARNTRGHVPVPIFRFYRKKYDSRFRWPLSFNVVVKYDFIQTEIRFFPAQFVGSSYCWFSGNPL